MIAANAPELANFDRFCAVMADFDLKVHREYIYPQVGACNECFGAGKIDGELCPRCGGGATEAYGGFWQVSIVRERQLHDGRLWMRQLTVDDASIERGFEEVWRLHADTFDRFWRRDMEEDDV